MMTDNENYCFDVFGYLVVRDVLSVEEIDACRRALAHCEGSEGMLDWPVPLCDPFVRLRDHPVLAEYLDELMSEEYRLVQGPFVPEGGDGCLVGGNEPRVPSRSYYKQNDVRFCQGVLAIWALSDVRPGDGGLELVPASHKSYVETPDDLVSGADEMGVVREPILKAGDLLLCVEMTLHRFNSSNLVVYGYASASARQETDQGDLEDWAQELTPEQKAVVAPSGGPDAPPVIHSDGKHAQLSERQEDFHPAILKRDFDCEIDENEFYHWDLCGHLVLQQIMDDAWLAAANDAIDACADQIVVGGSAAKGSGILAGTGVPSLHKLFELPKPYCDPFREMIAHPAVVQRLNWMMGSGFRCRSVRAICSVKGTSGHGLHSFSEPARPVNTYVLQNGRAYCDSINVAWQLRDVCESDGGFVCIPGSHKARYPSWPELITCEDMMDMVTHVGAQAGDVVMFMGAAQSHGAYPWKSDIDRRSVLLGYSSRNIS
jgi:hypothetical protein